MPSDGALGLWNSVANWPQAAKQRCWNHKMRNVVDVVPVKQQPDVLAALQRMAAADTVANEGQERQRVYRDCQLRSQKA